ncbi:tyrosine-type recombinase/integrase [Agromyces larvae]|uniref:Site-specific integrase n=1 Tax=Agromyces larvae TaxID=2929802 RepID=A0ABY4C324_9MICO|nr:site-specific integrase [Agromyces larvae]UOE45878.1 site-specific integrase [Agromyces larvae]
MPYVETLPSGRYRAAYRDREGKKRYVRGTFTHKRKAEIEAAAAEKAARSLGWRDPLAAGRTWGEWCADWWETRDVEPGTLHRDEPSRDNHLLPKWQDVPLIDITRGDVKAWAMELRKTGLAPATVQKRISLLSASLTAAVEAEVLDFNPARGVKVAQPQVDKRRYLTEEERDRLLQQFEPPVANWHDEGIVATLLGTGMRWGEAIGLQIPRVDFDRERVWVIEAWDDDQRRLVPYPKGKKQRWVPMTPWVAEVLEREIGGRRKGHVFLKGGEHVYDYSNWRRGVWLPAVKHAGLEGTKIHDLRHTFATHALQSGASLDEVRRMLGHSSSKTAEIYAKFAEEFGEHVVASLPTRRRGANVGQRGAGRGWKTLDELAAQLGRDPHELADLLGLTA